MATASQQKVIALSQFIDEAIFASRVSKASELIEIAKSALSLKLWWSFCSYAATQSTIGSLVDCIAREVKKRFAKMEADEKAELLRQMLEFFDELQAKAQKIGEDINVAGIIRVYNL